MAQRSHSQRSNERAGKLSIQGSTATRRPAQALDLLLLVMELVIIRDLFVLEDLSLRVNHDLLRALNGDDFCIAVRLEREKEKNDTKGE